VKTKRWSLFAVTVALLLCAGPVLAHHGEGAYDTTKLVTIRGTVVNFQFINPHILIVIDVKDAKGNLDHWHGELSSPNLVGRSAGWTKNTLRAGDMVILTGYRVKGNATALRLQIVSLANGTQLYPKLETGHEPGTGTGL
jgi:hypothetical protein